MSTTQLVPVEDMTVAQMKQELRERKAKVSGNRAELEERLKTLRAGRPLPKTVPKVTPKPPPQSLNDLTIKQLKDALRARGAKLSGNKEELITRLQNLLATEKPGVAPSLKFPPAPTTEPTGQVYVPKTPLGPVSKPIEETSGPIPEALRLFDLRSEVIDRKIPFEQLMVEAEAAGLPQYGSYDLLRNRLLKYLESISLVEDARWPTVMVNASAVSPTSVFNQFLARTTETVMQSLRPGDHIAFYNANSKTFHPLVVKSIDRTKGGLVERINLETPGFFISRRNGRWQLFQMTAAGAIALTGSFAAHLQLY